MAKFCKTFNILLEIVLLVISFLCAGFGTWLIFQEDWSLVIFGLYSVKTLGWVVVGGSVLIFLTSVIGFCGVLRENKMCVLMFVVIIGFGCILLVATASLLFTYQKKVHDFLGNQINKEFIDKYGFDATFTHTWDEIQSNLLCCGVQSGGGDYKSTKWFNKANTEFPREGEVPSSCCTRYENGSYVNHNDCMKERPENKSQYIYDNGCLEKLKEKIVRVTFGSAAALFVFSGILLLIMMSGCIMLRSISRAIYYGQVV